VRRNKREEKFVTIVSNLATWETVSLGEGRREQTLASLLRSLCATRKRQIQLCAMDMSEAFGNAVRDDLAPAHDRARLIPGDAARRRSHR